MADEGGAYKINLKKVEVRVHALLPLHDSGGGGALSPVVVGWD